MRGTSFAPDKRGIFREETAQGQYYRAREEKQQLANRVGSNTATFSNFLNAAVDRDVADPAVSAEWPQSDR
jgi:hypothetical protein